MTKREAVKSIAQYERDNGLSFEEPEGEFVCEVSRAEVYRFDDGRPVLNLSATITEGEYEKRRVSPRLEWFVSDAITDAGTKEMITQIVRRNSMTFLKAVFGRELEEAPESLEIMGEVEESDFDAAADVMQTWADSVVGLPIKVGVNYPVDDQGERKSDYPRYAFKRQELGTSSPFSL